MLSIPCAVIIHSLYFLVHLYTANPLFHQMPSNGLTHILTVALCCGLVSHLFSAFSPLDPFSGLLALPTRIGLALCGCLHPKVPAVAEHRQAAARSLLHLQASPGWCSEGTGNALGKE